MRDFTLPMYADLCRAIVETHRPSPVTEFYLRHQPANTVVMQHDIDKKPDLALKVADIEAAAGIAATYYFRTVPGSFDAGIMKKIEALGHEIGYHYEVLDTARGDPEKAIRIFEEDLEKFPSGIRTICMHGNPLTPWDNRDLWKVHDFGAFDIVCEAYLSFNFSDILYYTDTGRTWNGRYAVKDTAGAPREAAGNMKSTPELIAAIRKNPATFYVVTHPQRWTGAYLPWTCELVGQSLKNIGKRGIMYCRQARGAHERF